MPQRAPESLRGKTVRWAFDEGPTRGVTFEHVFNQNGSVAYRIAGQEGKGESAKECAVEKVTDDVYVISYLAPSGYTLTVVLKFRVMSVISFASNEEGWYPAKGSFELIE